ncbi:protein phosphatase regulator [Coemansia sp. RSA 1939]|nr:protein phosphatase regulator [Coemansia sp. RSA 1939]KAJ2594068.1 protein phosphatase regulator [Coemansia sp. RSA 1804]KAJ2687980.1 protein phosphatase regulator [Coemansia sp. RSA 1285]
MNFQGLDFDGVPTDPDLITDDNESDSSLVDEDVDFEYVYALFHFPRMVDGQVKVDEGEKLLLLDDSNSYWWLVQNLHDKQMGYIPAENIETAFGKLARVNRRRNMKLCRPDPEHIMNSRQPAVPKPNARTVVFNEKLVTEVFISAPVSEDEYSDDEYDYDYDNDIDDGEAEAEGDSEGAASQTNRHAYTSSQTAPVDAVAAAAARLHDDEFSEENDDYNYYYTADAGSGYNDYNHDHDNADDASSTASTPTARRISIAPMHMGQITGELMGDDVDSDSDADNDVRAPANTHGRQDDQSVPENRTSTGSAEAVGIYADHRRDSSLLTHVAADPAEYYPANEESDEGDSLNGALHRLNDSRASVESARHTIKIVHADSYNTAEASIPVFPDETFREVLRHSLALFSLTEDAEDDLILHAHLQQRELIPLGHDMRVSQLFEILHRKSGIQLPLSNSQISPGLCTMILADRTLPQGQLVLLSGATEDDPYTNMETGGRSILRTSIAASITEGISALAPSISKTSSGSKSLDDGAAVADDALPDSRKVVQGLLRSIPPPKSRPPQSAINKAKRNTVQINALGSVVTNDHQLSGSPTQPHNALSRSASTRSPSTATSAEAAAEASALSLNNASTTPQLFTETVDQAFEAHAELSEQIANSPVERQPHQHQHQTQPQPAVAAIANPSQVLVQSSSTLRPSSDTFTEEDGLSVDVTGASNVSANRQNGNTDADDEPLSPVSSSDTASIPNRDSEDGSAAAVAAIASGAMAATSAAAAAAAATSSVTALLHSNIHPHQKDGNAGDDGDRGSALFSDGELSLDDWLVILRGWRDINDMGANASFYQSVLNDMEATAADSSNSAQAHTAAITHIRSHVAELDTARNDAQTAIDDILSVSQGVGRRLDTLERELDDIARVLIHAS